MKVFTIIITYNALRNNWIENCLDSLRKSALQTKICIIDNNSSDKTVDFIKQHYPYVHLFEEKENLGFGQANNKGINYALEQGANYFFLLNQDAWVEPNTLDILCSVSAKNPEFAILSPIHHNGQANALDYNFSNYISPLTCKDLYSDIYFQNYSKTVYELPFVNAAA